MSHEIRTPLNAIYGFTELLNKTLLNENQKEMVNIIKTSVEILMGIINDILDISKIESGKIKIDNYPFNFEETIYGIRELFCKRALEKNLKLKFNLDKKLPKIIKGDKVRISQILINLIGNSIKFTEKGNIVVSLDFVSEDENKICIKFSVKDTGIGIENEKLETIFERFEQASRDTTRKYGGTGLGLSICKSLVELQGGKINVESTSGSVSSFYFTLFFDKLNENEIFKILEDEMKEKKNEKLSNLTEKENFNNNLKMITN